MRVCKLTGLAFMITEILDAEEPEELTLQQVRSGLAAGTIFDWLGSRIDLSFIEPVDKLELLIEWHDFDLIGLCPGSLKVGRNGWCVLLCYLMEGIQRRLGDPRYRLSEETALRPP